MIPRRRRPGDDPRPRQIDWGLLLLLIIAIELAACLITFALILINTTN
ncbi:hypothetical protein [Microlunatus parietis]|uniref:Uncharacterized protein n=1 Tax=Microlunatus parietis TaxID=682979 RepID=A0A7Y9L6J5_9ACTN|nr:hypothetical protein [Microlunatus parietis]NYE68849.1 hypothetical protein [Microlunatus parietis]